MSVPHNPYEALRKLLEGDDDGGQLVMTYSSERGQWAVGIAWGNDGEDAHGSFAAAAAYGMAETPREALTQALAEAGLEVPTKLSAEQRDRLAHGFSHLVGAILYPGEAHAADSMDLGREIMEEELEFSPFGVDTVMALAEYVAGNYQYTGEADKRAQQLREED